MVSEKNYARATKPLTHKDCQLDEKERYNEDYDTVVNLEKWQMQLLETLWGREKYEEFMDINKSEDVRTSTDNIKENESRMLKEANAIYAIGERLQAENFSLRHCFITPESIHEPHNPSAEICVSLLITNDDDIEIVDFDIWMDDTCIYVVPTVGKSGVNTINGAIMLNASYQYLEDKDDDDGYKNND